MKFAALSKKQQGEVLTEITQYFKDNGETEENAVEYAKEYIKDIDGRFNLVDYSPYEDETDLRVEW